MCTNNYHFECSAKETKWCNMSADLRNKWTCARSVSCQQCQLQLGRGCDTAVEEVSTEVLLLCMNSRLGTLCEVKKSVDVICPNLWVF